MPSASKRLLRSLQEMVHEGLTLEPGDALGLTQWQKFALEAVKPLDSLLAHRPIKKVLREPTRKAARASKAKAHRESTRAIRAAVMMRADGRCELCGWTTADWCQLELHHLEGGGGRRRQKQTVNNCVAVHHACHVAWHAGERLWPKAHPIAVAFGAELTREASR